MRIGGIASGMDTDTIVKNMMSVQRLPLDKLEQNKQVWQWKQDQYRDLNLNLLSFRNKAFDMRLQSSYIDYKAESSNKNVVTAMGTGLAKASVYDMEVTNLAKRATLASERIGDNEVIHVAGEPFEFTIRTGDMDEADAITISFSGDNDVTWSDVIKKLEGKVKDLDSKGIRLSIDKFGGQSAFSMVSKETGADHKIILEDKVGTFVESRFDLNSENFRGALGENAQFTINGISTERASNNFRFEGVDFSLMGEGTSTVKVEFNTDKAFDNIKSFIDSYNSMIEEVYSKLNEEKFRAFPPLTDEQRDSMSDKEIEKWEKKAQSGLLQRDNVLSNAMNAIRAAMTSTLKGSEISSIYEMGMTTGKYHENGKIYINEDKLREAIKANPEGVMKVFNNSEKGNEGLAQKLHTELGHATRSISDRAGSAGSTYDQSFISKAIRNIDDQARRMKDRLIQVEDRYWRQFTAMEKALSSMHQQGDWLTQQFSSMMGGR